MPLAVWEYMTNKSAWYIDVLLYIRGLLFVGEHFNSWILWYLLSALYGLLIIRLLIKRNKSITCILIYGAIIYVFGHNMVIFCGIENSELPRLAVIMQKALSGVGRLATGVFYISLGLWLSYKKIEKYKPPTIKAIPTVLFTKVQRNISLLFPIAAIAWLFAN
jgi:hypothetical protein